MIDPDIQYDIAFSLLKGMSATSAAEMLRRAGSTKNFFKYSREQLKCVVQADFGIFDDLYRKSLLDQAAQELMFIQSHSNLSACMIGSPDYPHRLSNCEDAPIMLYKLGNCNLDAQYVVAIVGTRHATYYGAEFISTLVKDLAKMIPGVVIVSGLAYGADACAHKAALEAGTPTVGILAHGLNQLYPSEHRNLAARMIKEGGALITEYTTSARLHRSNFLARNRIVAGLSDAVVVVESDYKGGSMSTARIASLYNREVFALPGRVTDTYSRGTNRLISNNTASLITCASDLIEKMNWIPAVAPEGPQPSLFDNLSEEQQMLIDFLRENPDATVNDLCVGLGLPYATVSDRLFKLEMEDCIIGIPGGRYAVKI